MLKYSIIKMVVEDWDVSVLIGFGIETRGGLL
jgi:hypothetical protein